VSTSLTEHLFDNQIFPWMIADRVLICRVEFAFNGTDVSDIPPKFKDFEIDS
jgi:hypothetical protein